MNGNCLDIGTIQAFLDGELTSERSARVGNHVADCDACALVLAEAEEETAVVFAALDREINTLVPTQRLWTKINDSIVVEKDRAPLLQKVWAFIVTQLANPSIAVAAGVLVVFSFFTAFWTMNPGDPETGAPTLANVDRVPNTPALNSDPKVEVFETEPESAFVAEPTRRTPLPRNPSYSVVRADYRERSARTPARVTPDRKPLAAPAAYVPGEESYVKTIAAMSQTVNVQKSEAMRPSEQVAFERDLAVVNDAIKKMRDVVQKNPRNEAAKQVLYTSYQNKIDLLNSVAQREELMASLK